MHPSNLVTTHTMFEARDTGLFIAIEGIDRTGKSTQASLLADALRELTERKTVLLKYPDRDTALGHCLNDYLKGACDIDSHALHLLFTANRWENENVIRDTISKGNFVITDRYSYSGIAYSAAKPPPTPSWQWCRDMEKGLPEPNLVICLAPAQFEHLKERPEYGEERYETDDFQQRVMENYVRIARDAKYEDYNEMGVSYPPSQVWHFVQATDKTVEEVHGCIMNIVKTRLKSLQLSDLQTDKKP